MQLSSRCLFYVRSNACYITTLPMFGGEVHSPAWSQEALPCQQAHRPDQTGGESLASHKPSPGVPGWPTANGLWRRPTHSPLMRRLGPQGGESEKWSRQVGTHVASGSITLDDFFFPTY